MLKNCLIGAVLALSLAGCGKKAPKCSDEEVQNLVLKIIKEQLQPHIRINFMNPTPEQEMLNIKRQEAVDSMTIKSIRTISHDEATGSYYCVGILFNSEREMEIKYKTEIADDGKEFYVSII